jgi:hypothetical protein
MNIVRVGFLFTRQQNFVGSIALAELRPKVPFWPPQYIT